MKLSVVATLYQSELHLQEFCQRTSQAAHKLVGCDYEIILVNDGSPDSSLELAIRLIEQYPSLIIVDLSRNFGHHKAMMTGLSHARGEKVFLIDSDLEEEPEWLHSFASQMAESTCDVVYGVQEKRKGGIFERYSGDLFYRMMRFLTKERLPENVTTARLMTQRYVKALLLHQEREVYIVGLWHVTGFHQQMQLVKKHSTSKTTYTFTRKVSLLLNSITSFSHAPLVGIFYVGLVIVSFGYTFSLYLIVKKILFHSILSGWTSVMASIWLLGGLIISFLGVIGIYLSKMFVELKKRPYTIVRQIYSSVNN